LSQRKVERPHGFWHRFHRTIGRVGPPSLALFALAVCLVSVARYYLGGRASLRPEESFETWSEAPVRTGVRPAALAVDRPYYRYSVIRGGAYDGEELARALAADPVAARHYRGFRVLATRAVPAVGQFVYVSYRVGRSIYWTSHPIRLLRGETLLSDGENCARARCGNRISPRKMSPTQRGAEPEDALDLPEQPVDGPPVTPRATALVAEVFPSAVPATLSQIAADPSALLPAGNANSGAVNKGGSRPVIASGVYADVPGLLPPVTSPSGPVSSPVPPALVAPTLTPFLIVPIPATITTSASRTVPAIASNPVDLGARVPGASFGDLMALPSIGGRAASGTEMVASFPLSSPPTAPPASPDPGGSVPGELPAAPESSGTQLSEPGSLILAAAGSVVLALGMARRRR